MKNSISKVALLLLCSVFALSSCKKNDSKDDSPNKKTATIEYRILINGDRAYVAGNNDGGIEQLYNFTEAKMAEVTKAFNIDSWTITETADTEEAAIAACDKKAVAKFDAKLTEMNSAALSIKDQFNTKKAELQSLIDLDKSTAHVIYKEYGGYLLKRAGDAVFPNVVVKAGTLYDMEAVGGVK